MNIKKNVMQVLLANCVELITGVVVSFFVPAVVSVSNYASIKTYTLYIGYIGLLSLGFYDGIYLKYGGKKIKEINQIIVHKEISSFIVFELALSIAFIIPSFIFHNIIWILFSASVLPINLFTFFKRLYQSTGEFKSFRNGMLVYSISYMIMNIAFSLVLRLDAVLPYCIPSIISSFFACIYCSKILDNLTGKTSYFKFDREIFSANVKLGFLVLFGNIAVSTIYSIDRWFIKFFFDEDTFAYYSFAVSMLNIVLVLIQSVAITLYNYFANNRRLDNILNAKKIIICLGSLSSAGYFLLNLIIRFFLPKYNDSLAIIAISFAAYPYMIAINAIYLNLYKAEKKNKKYICSVIFMIIISVVLNIIATLVHSAEAIALATTISFALWYYFCQVDIDKKIFTRFEILYLTIISISFLLSTQGISNLLIGALSYLTIWALSTYFYFKINHTDIIKLIKKIF